MYATPLELWDSLNLTNVVYDESLGTISSPDTTLELSNKNIIQDTVILYIDGAKVSEDDYTVNLEKGEITYTGSDTGDATVDYKFSPLPNDDAVHALESASSFVDQYTNTTFDGTETKDVYLKGQGTDGRYTLLSQPVDSISDIYYIENDGSEKLLTEGVSEDYIVSKNGFTIVNYNYKERITDDTTQFRIVYNYGYKALPAEIKRATIYIAAQEYLRLNVASKNILGRDNFDPETVSVLEGDFTRLLDQYRVEHMGLVAEEY